MSRNPSEQTDGDGRNSRREPVSSEESLPGLSLRDDRESEVVMNAARLALGCVSLAELGDPRYGMSPDGIPRVRVDEETYLVLNAE